MIGAAASAIPVAGKAGRGEDADVAGAGAAEPAGTTNQGLASIVQGL